jgi:Flp pilus assembly protein TadG
MKRLKDESGQVLVLSVLSMALLIGFLALAVDVGTLFRAKRLMQAAADSAAIAGAQEYPYGDTTAAANAAAGQNGVAVGVSGNTVTVNSPPLSGPFLNQAGYVEAIVSQSQPTFFGKIFTGNMFRSSVAVTARAVATNGTGNGCMYLLGSSGPDIQLSGSGTISVLQCGIFSNASVAISGSGSVDTKAIGVAAAAPGYSDSGSGRFNPLPTPGMAAVSDPLAYISQPSVPTYPSCPPFSASGTGPVTLTPGCYGGISVSGSGPVTFGAGNYEFNGPVSFSGSGAVTLGSGLYIFNTNGSFNSSGSSTVTGSGVTFYVTTAAGAFNLSGSGPLNLTAPTSGTYDGILFFQERGDGNTFSISGSGNMNLNGIFYMPSAGLNLSGSSSSTYDADFIASNVVLSGSGAITVNDYSLINSSTPLTFVRLVE